MQVKRAGRPGAAAAEVAILLPFLAFLFVIAVDWARLYYFSMTVANCARNGAVYAGDPTQAAYSPYADVTAAAQADAPNFSPAPTVTTASGSDSNGAYTDVTVSATFNTLTNFPGVPSATTVTRTVRAYTAPQTPN
jgi:Flp pilus assembly protein TadG